MHTVEFFISFYDYLRLLFSNTTKISSVVFAFPRLQYVNDVFLDKFTDPLISESNLHSAELFGAHRYNNSNGQGWTGSAHSEDIAIRIFQPT